MEIPTNDIRRELDEMNAINFSFKLQIPWKSHELNARRIAANSLTRKSLLLL